MDVQLNVKERLILANLLPQAKNLATMRIVEDLRGRLLLTAEEYEVFKINDDKPGRVEWGVSLEETVKGFAFARKEEDLIVAALRQLDESEEVTADHLPLFDKFGIE
jgi:hypothetical protein